MATINGTSHADTITGGSGDDTINGLAGDDILNGGGGDDFLYGGDGNDTLTGGIGSNDYFGGAGSDIFAMTARGAAGYSDDLIHDFAHGDKVDVSQYGISDITQIRALLYTDHNGEAAFNAYYDGLDHVVRLEGLTVAQVNANDFIFDTSAAKTEAGTDHDDVLFGTTGNDTLEGGAGNDVLLGGAGNDILIGGYDFDTYNGGAGFDRVSFAYSTEKVDVNLSTGVATWYDGTTEKLTSIEAVTGSSADNVLTGTSGNNSLDGGDGNDTLKGQGGNDVLIGGKGADTITGGTGDDTFYYRAVSDSTVASAGQDIITDFTTGDHIDLTRLEATAHESFDFIGTSAFSHTAGELRYAVVDGHTLVSLDVNGDGTADFQIQLSGAHTLSGSDFLL